MSPLQAFKLKRLAKSQAVKKKLKLWLRVHLTVLLTAGGGLLLLLLIILMIIGVMMVDSDSPSDSGCSSGGSGLAGLVNDMSGTNGDWTKKGTKSYNASKSIYEDALHDGCDAKHASAVVGNGLHESAFFGINVGQPWTIWPHQAQGGGGQGIFQFSPGGCPIPSDKSIAGQTKQILTNGGNDSEWKHMSGSPYSLGMAFDSLIERGDETTDRGTLSQKAYELFGGLSGGSTSSDVSDTASSSSSSCGGDSGSTSNIVKFAESQLGKHPYDQPTRNQIFTSDGADGSHADCSSFGNFVYWKTGHVHKPSGNAWTTSAGIYGLKRISGSETKPGDSVVVPSGGLAHWMILLQKWHGPSTMIIDEGGCTVSQCIKAGKPNNVNISEYKYAEPDDDNVFYTPEK